MPFSPTCYYISLYDFWHRALAIRLTSTFSNPAIRFPGPRDASLQYGTAAKESSTAVAASPKAAKSEDAKTTEPPAEEPATDPATEAMAQRVKRALEIRGRLKDSRIPVGGEVSSRCAWQAFLIWSGGRGGGVLCCR